VGFGKAGAVVGAIDTGAKKIAGAISEAKVGEKAKDFLIGDENDPDNPFVKNACTDEEAAKFQCK
jgi:hypothetical protein